MKVLTILLIILMLVSASALSLSCFPESDSESAPEQQLVTVQRGDLTVDITASGNLALSRTEDLAFDIPGRVEEITVEEILVEEGDSVEEGQLLAKLDTSEWDEVLINLERNLLQAEIDLKNAELALDKAEAQTVTLITGDIVYAESFDDEEIDILELRVELAEAKLEDAQKALEEALQKSPEVIAPFGGFITKVNVEGGDEVLPGTVAVQLADPNKFEADILVSEMDIFQVKLGGDATVQLDAMPMLTLPAKVTHISPTATIQTGVVNYKVKVELEPLGEIMPAGQTPPAGQMLTMIPEGFQLREGLTVTVSIIMQEKSDVLLVPNGAITRRGMETLVQVSKDGVIEERAITTGISNWQYTEVISGLNEGEEVVVTQGTPTTSGPTGPMPFFGPPPR
ncbi:MAG: efflux RND transporter periplasmic adaptor subunit [Dehalococcoidales bacterium]